MLNAGDGGGTALLREAEMHCEPTESVDAFSYNIQLSVTFYNIALRIYHRGPLAIQLGNMSFLFSDCDTHRSPKRRR